jgi:hypothetical protein
MHIGQAAPPMAKRRSISRRVVFEVMVKSLLVQSAHYGAAWLLHSFKRMDSQMLHLPIARSNQQLTASSDSRSFRIWNFETEQI